jgi:hypothetical protein
MENLFDKDASFELNSSMNGADVLNSNRTLMSYPSEKSSFQVFLGADGQFEDLYFEGTEDKPKYDAEKIAQGVTATAGAIGSVGSTIQAFKGDGSKAPSRRKQLKEVCGRKPILKKKRGEYDKCVAQYNANKISGGSSEKSTRTISAPIEQEQEDEKPKVFTTKNIVIGVVVLGVIATAFIGFKKGWFSKKG